MASDVFCDVSEGKSIMECVCNSWQMPELFPIFTENEVDMDMVLELDLTLLDRLLPSTFSVGYKMKLLKKVRDFNLLASQTHNSMVVMSESCAASPGPVEVTAESIPFHSGGGATANLDPEKLLESDSNIVVGHQSGFQKSFLKRARSSSPAINVSSGEVFKPDDNGKSLSESSSDLDSDSEPLNKLKYKQERFSKQKKPNNILPDCQPAKPPKCNKVENKKTQQVNPQFLANQKSMLVKSREEVNNLDLKQLLEESLDGKAILNSYKMNGCLEADDRSELVNIVVKWLLLPTVSPKKEEFTFLKNKILELFPNEVNVFYIAPREDGDHQTLARGKLFDGVRNLKDWMCKKGLLSNTKSKGKLVSNQNKEPVIILDPDEELTDQVKSALEWLKAKREPWEKVEEKWTISSKYKATRPG